MSRGRFGLLFHRCIHAFAATRSIHERDPSRSRVAQATRDHRRPVAILVTVALTVAGLVATAPVARAANSITTPDGAADVGLQSSLALDSAGNPVVSYYDQSTNDLKILHCNDPNCASGGDSITAPDTTGSLAFFGTSLVLDASGNPVVAYDDTGNGNLKIMHCNDPNCAGNNESITTADNSANDVGRYPSLKLDASGKPVVAYQDGTVGDIKVLHCDDVNCAVGGDSITTPDTAGDLGYMISLALDSSGNPVVTYDDFSASGDLRVLHCNDPNCASGGDSITTPDSAGDTGHSSSLVLDASGNPVISYGTNNWSSSGSDLKVLHCNDPNCAGGDDTAATPVTIGNVGWSTSLKLDSTGKPVIAHQDNSAADLWVIHCDDVNCSGDESANSFAPDVTQSTGYRPSLALDSTGKPVVSYYFSNTGDLRILHCEDAVCTTPDTTAPPGVPLSAPADGAVTTDTTPDFDWFDVSDPSGVTYTFQADNSGSSFPSAEINQTGIVPSNFTPGSGLADGTYSWRVRATDGANNVGPFSSVRTITIDTTPPVAPTPSAPADGASTDDTTPDFDWNDVSGASSYDLLVDNNSDFSSPEVNQTGLSNSNFTPGTAFAHGTYHWKVRARDALGNIGSYSAVRSFAIVGVDQQQLASGANYGGNPGGSYHWGQYYTAGQNNIVSFDLRACHRGTNPHTIVVRQGTTGANLAVMTATLPAQGNPTAVTRVDIPGGGVALTPGTQYSLLVVDGNGFADMCSSGSIGEGYAPGGIVFSGQTFAGQDLYFKTYYSTAFTAPTGTAPDLDAASDSGTSSTDNRTSDTTPTFTGSATADSTVRIFANGVEVGSGTATGGAYSITTSALSNGGKNITRTVDGGSPSPNLVVFIDTTAPTVPSAIDLVATDSGASGTDNITNDTTLLINGTSDWTADQATSINVLVDGVTKATGNSISGGGVHHFSLTTSALTEGVKSVSATATDVAGNTSAAATPLSVTIDLTPPSAPALTVPADGDLTTDTTPTFDWDEPSGASQYDLQVDNNSNFGSPEINLTNLNVSTHTPGTALADGTYSWRVRSRDAAGNLSAAFSATRTVVIDTSPPAAPTLVSPADAASTNDATPAFDWGDAADAASYELLVDNDADFSSPTIDQTGIATSAFTPGSALADGTYSWKVRARDGAANAGPYSSVRTFTVDTAGPTAPTLTAPTDAAQTNDATPAFDWSDIGDAASYELLVDNDSDFSSPTIDQTGISPSNFTPGPALADATYSWKVRARDAASNPGTYSSVRTFTVDTAGPAAPTLSAPADTAHTNDATPAFDWSDIGDAASYELLVDNDSDFSSPTIDQTGIAPSNFSPGSALADGTYSWKVRARDAATNAGTYSAVRTFTVDTVAPGAPSVTASDPVSPANENTPKIKGSAASGATVKVYASSNCSTSVLASGPATTFSSPGLSVSVGDDTTTTFFATATDAAGNASDCSSTSVTYIEDSTAPPSPTLVAPADGAVTNDATPAFDWSDVGGAASYELLVDDNSDFSSPEIDQTAIAPSNFTPGSALADGTYSWKVRARDATSNAGAYSSVRTLTVDTVAPSAPALIAPANAAHTNDATPALDWSDIGDAASYELLVDNNTDFSSPTIDQTGIAPSNFTPGSALSAGAYSWKVRARDAATNAGEYSSVRTFTVDTAAPVAPDVNDTDPESPANDNAPKIKGSAESGSTVMIYASSGCSTSVLVSGPASTFAASGLAVSVGDDTTTTLYATSTDAAGNTSDCSSSSQTYVEDSTAPSAPSIDDFDPESPANENSPKVKGTAEAGSTVAVYPSDDCTGTPVGGSAAGFSSPGITVTVADDSSNDFTADATDAAGNTSDCSAAETYVEDSTAPDAPSIDDFDPNSPANENSPKVKGTAEAGSTVSVYPSGDCSGTAVTDSAVNFASPGFTFAVNDDSSNPFSATATDASGNTSDCSDAETYVEDSTAPNAPDVNDTDPESPANDNAPKIKGSAESGSTVKIYASSDCSTSVLVSGPASTFAASGLAVSVGDDTTTTLYATSTDAAGNTSDCSSSSQTYVEDSTVPSAPALQSTDPASPSNQNSPNVKGFAQSGSTVTLYTSADCTGTTAGTGSAAVFASPGITVTVGADSETTFYGTATDAGGTSACSDGITYIEDSTAPSAPSVTDTDPNSPADDNSPEVKGVAASGSTVKVYSTSGCTGSPLATGSAANYGSVGLTVSVADGSTTTFRATATDAAGNASACSSTSQTYVEDSTAPAAPSITSTDPASPANNNAPKVKGTAESASTVLLYKTSDCTGTVAATGTAADFASPGLTITVLDDTVTPLSATATDAAGNESSCSAASSYTEVSPVTMSVDDPSVTEGNAGTTNLTFTITASRASTSTMSVKAETANNTARSPSDYDAFPLTKLTFAPGIETRQVVIAVNGDLSDEPNESFFLDLSAPVGATITDAQGIGTILDDPDPTPELSIGDVTKKEGDGGATTFSFTVSLSEVSGHEVRFTAETADGTATAPADYTQILPTEYVIPAGSKSGEVNVKIKVKADGKKEGAETFFVNLSLPVNATILDGQAMGTIKNDD